MRCQIMQVLLDQTVEQPLLQEASALSCLFSHDVHIRLASLTREFLSIALNSSTLPQVLDRRYSAEVISCPLVDD